jgi:hypothetical protein
MDIATATSDNESKQCIEDMYAKPMKKEKRIDKRLGLKTNSRGSKAPIKAVNVEMVDNTYYEGSFLSGTKGFKFAQDKNKSNNAPIQAANVEMVDNTYYEVSFLGGSKGFKGAQDKNKIKNALIQAANVEMVDNTYYEGSLLGGSKGFKGAQVANESKNENAATNSIVDQGAYETVPVQSGTTVEMVDNTYYEGSFSGGTKHCGPYKDGKKPNATNEIVENVYEDVSVIEFKENQAVVN